MNNKNNQLIFTKWCIPVPIFGAFLITIFGAYSVTDYNFAEVCFWVLFKRLKASLLLIKQRIYTPLLLIIKFTCQFNSPSAPSFNSFRKNNLNTFSRSGLYSKKDLILPFSAVKTMTLFKGTILSVISKLYSKFRRKASLNLSINSFCSRLSTNINVF